jgi:hypothetical protein
MTDVTREGISLLSDRYYNLCIIHRQKHADKKLIEQLSAAAQRLANKQLHDVPQLKTFGDFFKQVCIIFQYYTENSFLL